MDTQLAELMSAVARVEGGVLGIRDHLDRLEEVSVKRLDDHADRIDGLETTRDRQKGAAKVVAALLGAAGAIGAFLGFRG